MLRAQLAMLTTLLALLRKRHHRVTDAGSVTLEQIAITAGLLALAIGAVAGIGVAVAKYMNKL